MVRNSRQQQPRWWQPGSSSTAPSFPLYMVSTTWRGCTVNHEHSQHGMPQSELQVVERLSSWMTTSFVASRSMEAGTTAVELTSSGDTVCDFMDSPADIIHVCAVQGSRRPAARGRALHNFAVRTATAFCRLHASCFWQTVIHVLEIAPRPRWTSAPRSARRWAASRRWCATCSRWPSTGRCSRSARRPPSRSALQTPCASSATLSALAVPAAEARRVARRAL